VRAGVDGPRAVLDAMVRDGLLRHAAGPVYLPADAVRLAASRLAVLRLLAPEGSVVCRLAAAWAHGAGNCPDPVEVLRPRALPAGRTPDGIRVHESTVPPHEVLERDGVRLTTRARTAADVARWLPEEAAAPVVAGMLAGGLAADDVLEVLDRARRYRGAVRGRGLVLRLSRSDGR
jgi:hypothetical protein